MDIKSAKDRAGKLYGFESTYGEQPLTLDAPLMNNVVDIKATNEDVIVLTKNGKVAVLINGDQKKELTFDSKAVQISAGCEHAAVLLDNGQVYVWGSFEDPGFMFREPYLPVKVLRSHKIVEISSGRDHLVLLNNEGIVYTMGCGAQGQLGRVSARSAKDGGRQGPKLLLAPDRVHMNRKHRADRIWATKCGTFYRDMKTGQIFGCGLNADQTVSAAEKRVREQGFIFKPVLTTLSSQLDMLGDRLIMDENGDLFVCGATEKAERWSTLQQKGESIHCGPSTVHFIDPEGDVFEFKSRKRISPVYIASEANSARALAVCKTDCQTFLVIA